MNRKKILIDRLRRKIFNPGVTYIQDTIKNLQIKYKDEPIETQVEKIADELGTKSKYLTYTEKCKIIRPNEKGLSKIITDEVISKDFNKYDELFAEYMVSDFEKTLNKRAFEYTWNLKLYNLVIDYQMNYKTYNLRQLCELIFKIEAESVKESQHEWLGKVVRKYVQDELIQSNLKDKEIFKSNKITITASLTDLIVTLTEKVSDEETITYVRPFNLEELELFSERKILLAFAEPLPFSIGKNLCKEFYLSK